MRSDPQHLPETMAVQAVRLLWPGAKAAAARVRTGHRDLDPAQVRERVTAHGINASVLEGAFLGGPFMLLWPAAFVAALTAQLRMVLELAALSEPHRDPDALAADLLVLQGVSPSAPAARELLDAAGATVASVATEAAGAAGATGSADTDTAGESTAGESAAPAGWWTTMRHLSYLIGLLTPGKPTTGRLRQAAVWVGVVVLVVLGCAVPLLWIPASAEMYRRATTRLAARSTAYYASGAGDRAAEAPAVAGRWSLRPGAVLVTLRAAVAAVLILGVLVVVLVADVRIATSHLLGAAALLIGVSGLYAVVLTRRRRGRGNGDEDEDEDEDEGGNVGGDG
ncbi:hypothetical protein [Kitasatospora nipponensis]|uniref:hypothetical protein n=1 Tax=Kitasatospora nipponensis TaxID=258049 RepID=UPI0031D07B70